MTQAMTDVTPSYILPRGEAQWYLLVKVQPGAKNSCFAGEFDGRLKVKLAAQPIENKANKALVSFIAKQLGIRLSKVSLISGDTGRQKKMLIDVPLTEELINVLKSAGIN